MIALELQTQLEEMGAFVIGPAPSVDDALRCINDGTRIDAAILDVNLRGECAFLVADALCARAIPFLFSSGYEDDVTRSRYPDIMSCAKPITMPDFLRSVRDLIVDPALRNTFRITADGEPAR